MASIDLCKFNIEWDSQTGADLSDELRADNNQHSAEAMGAYFAAHKKQTTSNDQLQIVSGGISLIGAVQQAPLLASVFGVILLAAISPIALTRLSEKEGEFLKVLKKLKFGYIVDKEHVKAILKSDPLAEELIKKLCEAGLIRQEVDKSLWVKPCTLKNVKIL